MTECFRCQACFYKCIIGKKKGVSQMRRPVAFSDAQLFAEFPNLYFIGPEGSRLGRLSCFHIFFGDIIIQDQFPFLVIKPSRHAVGMIMGGKRTHHQDPLLQASALIGIHSLVHIYLAAQRKILPVRSMQQRPAPLSQSKTSLVKVQDTQRVLLLRLRIDEGVVGVDIEPGIARGKAGIRTVRPLHRRPRRIPRGDMDAGQSALDGSLPDRTI